MNNIEQLAYSKYLEEGVISPIILCRRYKIGINAAKVMCDDIWIKHFKSRFDI